MKNVLRITTSIFEKDSVSSMLMEELIAALESEGGVPNIVERNFREEPVPHLDASWLQALSTPDTERSAEQKAKVDYSDSLITELQVADTIVIALPMYNFSLPSMLKAWVDHIARAGATFKYTEKGSVGLLQDKKVYLVAAMGGIHDSGVTDFLRPYMKHILSFVGITDVEMISATGLNMGPEKREQGIAQARVEIAKAVSQQDVQRTATEGVA